MMPIDSAESGLDVVRLLFHSGSDASIIKLWFTRVAKICLIPNRSANSNICTTDRIQLIISQSPKDLDYFFKTSTMRKESVSESIALRNYFIFLYDGHV